MEHQSSPAISPNGPLKLTTELSESTNYWSPLTEEEKTIEDTTNSKDEDDNTSTKNVVLTLSNFLEPTYRWNVCGGY